MTRPPTRRPTATSNFGVGKREAHDATAFYERFQAPVISDDDIVAPHKARDEIWVGDSRDMDATGDIADGSVALVVTSPPYFAGKAYEEALGEGGIPADYVEYLQMLRDVFAECVRKLEPGGRIAVNVANLGRKPYRSLSADVITILQDDLGLLLRGEIIWQKGKGAGGSCAWGSFQSPSNPVLRDVTERVIVASKGRFDRAVDAKRRRSAGLPHVGTITVDDFLDATLDIWEFAPESAKRLNHPAPFPVELPERLINLCTYEGDLVLDPFMGAGSTAVAAARTGRHYVGFDTDAAYVEAATARVGGERAAEARAIAGPVVAVHPGKRVKGETAAEALHLGLKATEVAQRLLVEAGCTSVVAKAKVKSVALEFDLSCTDASGAEWMVLVVGTRTPSPSGLRRTDLLHRTLAHAAVLATVPDAPPLLVLTTELPTRSSPGAKALASLTGSAIVGVVDLLAADAPERLAEILPAPAS